MDVRTGDCERPMRGSIGLVPLVVAYVITFVLRFLRKQPSVGSEIVTGFSEGGVIGVDRHARR